jgi:hypothetical protein
MLISVLMGLVASSAVQAQVPQSSDIVVEGHRIIGEAQAQRAVQAISTSTNNLQIARFADPVCPLAVGMSAAAGTEVQNRIREIARDVGAKVAPAKCDANVIVIVANDSRALLADIRQNQRKWVAGVPSEELKRLASIDSPVRAWTVTSLRNEDGQALAPETSDAPTSMQVRTASFLSRTTRQQIDGAVVLIDRAAAKGRTIDEIAGYVAMRTLAATRVPKAGEVSSILNLFTPGVANPPRALTSFDRAYLKGLYAGNPRDDALTTRLRIAKTVAAGAGIN